MKRCGRSRRPIVHGVVWAVLLACASIYATSGLMHHRTRLGRLLCPICQVMAHGSTVLPKLPPVFKAPVRYRLPGRMVATASLFSPFPIRIKNQSRAPPTLE